jgi:hypothetical protein
MRRRIHHDSGRDAGRRWTGLLAGQLRELCWLVYS